MSINILLQLNDCHSNVFDSVPLECDSGGWVSGSYFC